jgi:hypothetical protein
MSFAYLVVLVEFYYVSLVFDMYSGVIEDHGKREKTGPRGHNMGELQARDLAI